MLFWNRQFETGIPEIDEQHRQLIGHLNKLEGLLLQTNFTRAEIESLLEFVGFLEGYVGAHFNHEEDCMKRLHCPMFEKNRQAHGQFLEMFQRFRGRLDREGLRLELVRDLNRTLHAWVEQHILRVDTALRDCSPGGS